MNINEFKRQSGFTESRPERTHIDPEVGALLDELFTRASDLAMLADDVKRYLFYGKQFDIEDVLKAFNRDGLVTGFDFSIDDRTLRLLHAALGKFTETIEFMEALRRGLNERYPLDRVHLLEEIGDEWWYDMIVCRVFGVDPETIMSATICKLNKRFPDKFNYDNAVFRELEQERNTLEQYLDDVDQ